MEKNDNRIMVSIKCLAYNHEKYIRKCLEGIVSQKTNFKFEVIVHDDASTDKTANIIHEFENNYPDIIKPIYEETNLYQSDIIALRKKMNMFVKGKYVAFCECDDYWIDENKLQNQVDFLENHKDYSMCFHNAIEHYEDNSQEDRQFSHIEDRDYTGLEIYETWQVPTASVMVKKEIFESDLYKELLYERDLIFTDIVLFLTASKFGKLRGMHDVMSVYRRQPSGVTAKAYFGTRHANLTVAYNKYGSVAGVARASMDKVYFYKRQSGSDSGGRYVQFGYIHQVGNPLANPGPDIDYQYSAKVYENGVFTAVGYQDRAPSHELWMVNIQGDNDIRVHYSKHEGFDCLIPGLCATKSWSYSY